MVPLGDAPNPPGIPFVTYALVAANVAVYLLVTLPLEATLPRANDPVLREYIRAVSEAVPHISRTELLQRTSAYDLFVFTHGFRPAAPHIPDLFYSMFLHAGFAHLFGNMLFLWIYGDNVEYRLGRLRYLLAYLGGGICAVLFYWIFASGSRLPLIGASGAISGVLGFYFVWFPGNRIRLLLMFPFFGQVLVPARVVLTMYLVVDNLLPFLFTGGNAGGVAHGAHIGGFVAGLAGARLADWQDAVRARQQLNRW